MQELKQKQLKATKGHIIRIHQNREPTLVNMLPIVDQLGQQSIFQVCLVVLLTSPQLGCLKLCTLSVSLIICNVIFCFCFSLFIVIKLCFCSIPLDQGFHVEPHSFLCYQAALLQYHLWAIIFEVKILQISQKQGVNHYHIVYRIQDILYSQ